MKLTEQQKNRVEELLSRMTLEEKIGQMNLESPSIVGGFDVPFEELIEMMTDGRISQEEFQKIMSTATRDFHEEDIRAGLVGAMMGDDPVKANELQKIAVEESRLGIPLIMHYPGYQWYALSGSGLHPVQNAVRIPLKLHLQ